MLGRKIPLSYGASCALYQVRPREHSMPSSAPFFREAGNGPNVVCLHSSAASSAQWRPLMDQLGDKYRVLAVDLYGEGKSPPWTSARDCTIDDELELLNPLLDERAPFILVGHS